MRKVPHATDAKGGDDVAHKRGLNTKTYLAVNTHEILLCVIAMASPVVDCMQAAWSPKGIATGCLMANKCCGADAIVADESSRRIKVMSCRKSTASRYVPMNY